MMRERYSTLDSAKSELAHLEMRKIEFNNSQIAPALRRHGGLRSERRRFSKMFQNSERSQLHNHPRMFFRGRRNWPPEWFPTPSESGETVTGEIGNLEEVFRSVLDESTCYLIIRNEGRMYIGVLRFDDSDFCKEIADLLQHNNGRPIHEIGSTQVGSRAQVARSGDRFKTVR